MSCGHKNLTNTILPCYTYSKVPNPTINLLRRNRNGDPHSHDQAVAEARQRDRQRKRLAEAYGRSEGELRCRLHRAGRWRCAPLRRTAVCRGNRGLQGTRSQDRLVNQVLSIT